MQLDHARVTRESCPNPGTAGAPPLPPALTGLVRRVAEVQALTLEAALQRDADLSFQALLLVPLVTIPTDKAHAMFREMLENTKKALPGWKV
jgi:alpha-galactosidase/6-phospho-beta-glucosidase family protein